MLHIRPHQPSCKNNSCKKKKYFQQFFIYMCFHHPQHSMWMFQNSITWCWRSWYSFQQLIWDRRIVTHLVAEIVWWYSDQPVFHVYIQCVRAFMCYITSQQSWFWQMTLDIVLTVAAFRIPAESELIFVLKVKSVKLETRGACWEINICSDCCCNREDSIFLSVFFKVTNNQASLLTFKMNLVHYNIVIWEKKNMFFPAHSSHDANFSSVCVIDETLISLEISGRAWSVENRFLPFNTKPSTRS